LVLPEDDANRQLALGFRLQVSSHRQFEIQPPAGGWGKVLDCFESDHIGEMEKCPNRYMVLLIDFDSKEDRLQYAKDKIPGHLAERVFVLGTLSEPEALRASLGCSYEMIGSKLAVDCRDGTSTAWDHPLLRHNAEEVKRLRASVRPILFA
jgi:hypothetical protein